MTALHYRHRMVPLFGKVGEEICHLPNWVWDLRDTLSTTPITEDCLFSQVKLARSSQAAEISCTVLWEVSPRTCWIVLIMKVHSAQVFVEPLYVKLHKQVPPLKLDSRLQDQASQHTTTWLFCNTGEVAMITQDEVTWQRVIPVWLMTRLHHEKIFDGADKPSSFYVGGGCWQKLQQWRQSRSSQSDLEAFLLAADDFTLNLPQC